MVSLMNGLSALGQGVSAFAGQAGLEQQKATLAQQSMVLADQLATTRETTLEGQRQAGAQTLQGQQQTFLAGESQLGRAATAANLATTETGANTRLGISETGANTRLGISETGANTRNAASIAGQLQTAQLGASTSLSVAATQSATEKYRADLQSKDVYAQIEAAAPARQQEILASQSKVAFEKVQTENATALKQAHDALQAEVGKPDADPTKIAALKTQVTSLETSASTEAAVTTAAAAMYRTDMDSVQHFNTQLVTATAALNNPEMSDTDRTAQKGLIANLKVQLSGAQRALQYSSDLMHGRVAAQTGNEPPTAATGNRPPLASFGGGKPLPNPNAGPRAVAPAAGLGLINGMVQ